MSAIGTKRTVPLVLTNVCFEGNNGQDAVVTRRLLMSHSGHSSPAVPMNTSGRVSAFAANHGPDTAMTVRGGNIPRESG